MAGEIGFTPSERDYVDANKDWFRASLRTPRATRRRFQLLALTGGLGGAVGFLEGGLRQVPISAGLAASIFFTFIAIVLLGTYFLLPRRAGRLYRQQKSLQQQFRYSWDEDGIALRTSTSEGRYAWSQFYSWTDGRTAVLLFHNEQLFYFLSTERSRRSSWRIFERPSSEAGSRRA